MFTLFFTLICLACVGAVFFAGMSDSLSNGNRVIFVCAFSFLAIVAAAAVFVYAPFAI